MRVCPHCELPTVEAGSFCPSCGKPMPAQDVRPQQALMGTFRFPPAAPAGKASPAPTAAPVAQGQATGMRPVVTNVGPAVAASPPRLGSSAMIGLPASGSTAGPRGGSSAAMAPPGRGIGGAADGSVVGAAQGSAIRRNVPSPAPMQRIEPMAAALVPTGSPTADSIEIPDPRNALLGVVVDGFSIDSILGTGGCGTVYRGRQVGLDRPVAIKVPTFDVVDDPVLKKRFLREARAAARVRHPSVVTIYGVGEVPDGRPYLAMELLEGVSLLQVLDDGPLPVPRALALARQIALALAETHAAGVVHRDLKPSNIIWRRDRSGADRITIVDFGIAAGQQGSADATRLTAGGKVIGTPHYMAPEQAQGEHQDIDHRTDLYALGCVLFELLTNDVPFDGTGFDVVLAHMAKQPEAPSKRLAGIPPQVDELVLQLMRKRPEERPASAEEVVKRIDAVQAALALAPPRREGPRVPTAPATAETATDLVMATDDTAAAMAAEGAARAPSIEDTDVVAVDSGWAVGYAAPEAAHRDERSGRAERTGGRGRGEGREDGRGSGGDEERGEKSAGGRGATSAGVGAASTMLAVAKVTPPRVELQSQPQLGAGHAGTQSQPQLSAGHAASHSSQPGAGHAASQPGAEHATHAHSQPGAGHAASHSSQPAWHAAHSQPGAGHAASHSSQPGAGHAASQPGAGHAMHAQPGAGHATPSQPDAGHVASQHAGHAAHAQPGGHAATHGKQQPGGAAVPHSQPQLGRAQDAQGIGHASTVPQMADRHGATPPSQPPQGGHSHGTSSGSVPPTQMTRSGTLAPGQTGMAPRRATHQLSSAALARRRHGRWKLAAVAMGVCLAAALAGIGLQRMLRSEPRPSATVPPLPTGPGAPGQPEKPPGEPSTPAKPDDGQPGKTHTFLLTSAELSMRMTAPAVLRANQKVRIRMEIWDGNGEPLDTRVVVTIELPKGTPIGIKANVVTRGVYEFEERFAVAGRNVVTAYPEGTDESFEAPFEVLEAGAANDGKPPAAP